MSYLLEKSNDNIKAAIMLDAAKIYNPIVHCSYYSVFQRICHSLITYEFLDYQIIKNEYFSELEKKKHIGHHEVFIRAFEHKLSLKMRNKREYNNLIDNLGRLKRWRVDFDYNNTLPNAEIPEQAFNKATEINKQIDRLYNGN